MTLQAYLEEGRVGTEEWEGVKIVERRNPGLDRTGQKLKTMTVG